MSSTLCSLLSPRLSVCIFIHSPPFEVISGAKVNQFQHKLTLSFQCTTKQTYINVSRLTTPFIPDLEPYKIKDTNTVFTIFVPVFCNIYLSTANLIYFFVQFFVHVRGRMLTVSGDCRQLSFRASFSFTAKRLQNHTIRTQQVPDVNSCERLCFWESNCVSINFKEETGSCELNNATHRGYDYHLVDDADYVYHGADVRVHHNIYI